MNLSYLFKTFRVATPIVIAQLVLSISGFLGMMMLARLGHDVLAASGLLYATQMVITIIGISPLLSLSAIVAQEYGKDQRQEIGNLMQQAWLLSVIIAIIIMLLYAFVRPILLALGQNSYLVGLIVPYFHIAILGMPPLVFNMANSQFFSGIGKQKLTALVATCGVVFTIALGYVLINGKFGMPALGVAGWGIAFVAGMWFQAILFIIILSSLHEFKTYYLFKSHLRKRWRHLIALLKIGWPVMLQTGGELLSFSFVVFMAGWLGKLPLAAMQVAVQFLLLIIIPSYGITIAAGVLVARAIGAKKYLEAKRYGDSGLLLSLIILIIIAIIMNVFPHQLARLYLSANEPHYHELLHTIRILFIIIAASQFFDNIRNSLTGALRGMFDTKVPMLVGLICIWLIRMPSAYLLAFTLDKGVYGISFSGVFSMAIAGLWLWRRWIRKTQALIVSA